MISELTYQTKELSQTARPPLATETKTDGMRLVVQALKLNGVKTIFGVVGIPVTDLARHAQEEGIRYIGFRHEQSAGNAAAAAGYLNKFPGVLLTVSAPGFLNGLSALANATQNGFPMIQISGSSDRNIIDLQQGDYEGLDQLNIAKPFAKAAYRINRPEDIGTGIARAVRAALSGRPGGVYLDLTTALLASEASATTMEKKLFTPVDPAPVLLPDEKAVARALDVLATAKQPLVILGKGAAYTQADSNVKKFVETLGAPYLPMSMAKGLLPDDHSQSAAAARSFVLKNADVVILVGARLNWLLAHGTGKHWNPDVRFVQLDIEPVEFDSNRPIAAPVAGDIGASLELLTAGIRQRNIHASDEWQKSVTMAKQENIVKMAAKLADKSLPMTFLGALSIVRDILEKYRDIYLVNEGANTLDNTRDVINQYYPRRRLDCGTWGVMGVGMGFAIGAATAGSGKMVVAIEGDSAFGFSGMDISTVCRYKLSVITIVFNNGGIYRGDRVNLGGGADPSPTTLNAEARYDKMIEAFGGTGYYAGTHDELRRALEKALNAKQPALINCVISTHDGTESGHIGNLNPQTALNNNGMPAGRA